MYNYTGQESLNKTNIFHNNRKIMNEKWRTIGSPQTDNQKNFVRRLFKPVFIENIHNKNTYYNLNNQSNHHISFNHKNYKNINICYYCIKYPILYNTLINCKNYYEFKNIINIQDYKTEHSPPSLLRFMTQIIEYKVNTFNEIQNLLIRTFLRPIVYIHDNINIGKIYCNLRHNLYLDYNL
tara:strand:- start:147 stop:689 length:543 start_codon:yes stop_codon:yes gene_type:complete